jgi:hypothetical protein
MCLLVGFHDVGPGEGSQWCVISTIPKSGHYLRPQPTQLGWRDFEPGRHGPNRTPPSTLSHFRVIGRVKR